MVRQTPSLWPRWAWQRFTQDPLWLLVGFVASHLLLWVEGLHWYSLTLAVQMGWLALGLCLPRLRLPAGVLLSLLLWMHAPFWGSAPEACLKQPDHLQGTVLGSSQQDSRNLRLIFVTARCGQATYALPSLEIQLASAQGYLGWFTPGDEISLRHLAFKASHGAVHHYQALPKFRSRNLTLQQKDLEKSSAYFQILAKSRFYQTENGHALFQALAIADKSDIGHQERAWIQKLGLSHLFAVSGLHIGILFLWIRLALRPLFIWPRNWLKQGRLGLIQDLCALGLIVGYVLFIGSPISAMRAVEMLVWWVLLRHLLPYQPIWFVLFGVASLMLVFEPSSLGNISFQLSFLSVFAIFWGIDWLQSRPHPGPWKKLLHGVQASVLLTVWIFLFLLPLTLTYFRQASLLSIPSNLVHIYLISFWYLPIALLTLGLAWLTLGWGIPAEWVIFWPINFLGEAWIRLLEFNGYAADWGLIQSGPWPWWAMVLWWGGLAGASRWLMQRFNPRSGAPVPDPSRTF